MMKLRQLPRIIVHLVQLSQLLKGAIALIKKFILNQMVDQTMWFDVNFRYSHKRATGPCKQISNPSF